MKELISFGMYLTGHDQETVEQMYRDYIGRRITVKSFDTYVDDVKFSNFTLTKKGELIEIDNGKQVTMIKFRIMDLSHFRRITEQEGLFVVSGTIHQLCVILDSL